MTFPSVPNYSKNEIKKAGNILISEKQSSKDIRWAREILSKWRACHAYPINTFRATLTKKLKAIKGSSIVAQRLKRMPTIIDKLKRYPTMKLSTMQDIGGLRAVVRSIEDVRKIESIYDKIKFEHILVKKNDYIKNPRREDGYRSLHLIYKYKNPSNPQYDGLKLELQVRTQLQHAWATAVETMGTFLGQALKSRQGDKEWLDFFTATSSAFAHLEKSPLVPGYDETSDKIFNIVKEMERELDVLNKMKGFNVAVNEINKRTMSQSYYYHLIILDSINRTLQIKSYARNDLKNATADYTAYEDRAARGEKIEPVLVSVGPLKYLRRAYPNYFLDTNAFIGIVTNIISRK